MKDHARNNFNISPPFDSNNSPLNDSHLNQNNNLSLGERFSNAAKSFTFEALNAVIPPAEASSSNNLNNAESYKDKKVPIFSLASKLPLLPQSMVDSVGYGDGVSFGLTDWIRDKFGTNSVVNKDSFTYKATFIAGVATPIGGGLSQIPQVKKGADYANLMWKYRTLGAERLALRREVGSFPRDRIQHETIKTEFRQQMGKPYVEDQKLAKLIDRHYRPSGEIGSGSTADAIRREIATGEPTKGKFHIQKGHDDTRFLRDWINNNSTGNPGDRAAAENILSDLQDALGNKPWYSNTIAPK